MEFKTTRPAGATRALAACRSVCVRGGGMHVVCTGTAAIALCGGDGIAATKPSGMPLHDPCRAVCSAIYPAWQGIDPMGRHRRGTAALHASSPSLSGSSCRRTASCRRRGPVPYTPCTTSTRFGPYSALRVSTRSPRSGCALTTSTERSTPLPCAGRPRGTVQAMVAGTTAPTHWSGSTREYPDWIGSTREYSHWIGSTQSTRIA